MFYNLLSPVYFIILFIFARVAFPTLPEPPVKWYGVKISRAYFCWNCATAVLVAAS